MLWLMVVVAWVEVEACLVQKRRPGRDQRSGYSGSAEEGRLRGLAGGMKAMWIASDIRHHGNAPILIAPLVTFLSCSGTFSGCACTLSFCHVVSSGGASYSVLPPLLCQSTVAMYGQCVVVSALVAPVICFNVKKVHAQLLCCLANTAATKHQGASPRGGVCPAAPLQDTQAV